MAFSFWSLEYFILIIELLFCTLLLLPSFLIPKFLTEIINKIKWFAMIALVVFSSAAYKCYLGYKYYFPFTTIQDQPNPEKLSYILSHHYKNQRNFYISVFAITILLIIIRLSYIQKEIKSLNEKITELENTDKKKIE
jgi:uncharacterized membrane protein